MQNRNTESSPESNPFSWYFNETDTNSIGELQDFLPDRIFDSHAHIYRVNDLNLEERRTGLWSGGEPEVSIQEWRKNVVPFFPKADLVGGLFFPAPLPMANIHASNAYLMAELDQHPASRGLALVTPQLGPEDLAEVLTHPQVVGLKPYHVYSKEKPTSQSTLSGFFPEFWWKWAHENAVVVMMHIMRDGALSDKGNVQEIRRLCLDYPGIKLVLAHTGRSFHAPNARGMKALQDLENVWFDQSGICESSPMEAVIDYFGPQKLLWGSDFPVSALRGRAVTMGDGFFWMDPISCDWSKSLGNPILVGIESLRALRQACHRMSLSPSDISQIFYGNIMELLERGSKKSHAGQHLYSHAKTRIPGGVQLLSKRPENMAPGYWPPYFREAKGSSVWDMDGKQYYDFSTNAVGSCLLGYAHAGVNAAVIRRVRMGNMSSLNPPEEVALADQLCQIHPWAEQARFVRGGGEACAVAVRISRATTQRSKVAVCGYHGWQDWYLAANLGGSDALRGHLLPGLEPSGVPKELRNTTFTFKYNDEAGFKEIMASHGHELAAVVMEPCRNVDPNPGFLETIREETKRKGCLLVFDEITVGWRLAFGGAHLTYGIQPDMSVFAKALGNGYPIGAVIGTREAMEGAQGSFISSTYWTESIGPVAALAVLEEMQKENVPKYVEQIGSWVQDIWHSQGKETGLKLKVAGFPCLSTFSFDGSDPEMLRTIFTQQMLERGYLAGTAFYPTLAHSERIVKRYANAVGEVFESMANHIGKGSIASMLKGEVAKSGFARLV
ncbi:aminotransferase class III-fold pyridoxal phosphate-dependent enzyme [Pleomorphovibrio marinus]|uniref:aminotransferase class III-fold pyridoxal phosphate-dependent enzyme n=1 Tax=Pleomorphovibrio marinus TaxID=2164132 RepID=UPI000E0C41F3|nr:aminotransferase class III-fold pyridoxal phosphate-dependent enzyme [Pleomorphovibrio marinus]